MLKPSNAERQARHISSGGTSRSSVVTLRPLQVSTSPSRSGTVAARDHTAALGRPDAAALAQLKRSRSTSPASASRISSVEDASDDIHVVSGKWDPPNVIKSDEIRPTGAYLRPSVLSAPQASYASQTRRSPSPTKKWRPNEVTHRQHVPAAPSGTMARGGTAFPIDSPLLGFDVPRTPLLYERQMHALGEDEDLGYLSVAASATRNFFSSHQPVPRRASSASSSRGSNQPQPAQGNERSIEHSQTSYQSSRKPSYASSATRSRQSSNSEDRLARNPGSVLQPLRRRSRRDKDKKTLLASALQRANDAVQLDNACDYAGARDAYLEACEFLTFVMANSSGEADKRKLATIVSVSCPFWVISGSSHEGTAHHLH